MDKYLKNKKMEQDLENFKQEVDEKFKILLDRFDTCIISSRDSVPPSLSNVVMEMIAIQKDHTKQIGDLTTAFHQLSKEFKPVSEKFEMVNGFGGTFMLLAKYAGAGTAIYFAFKYLFNNH